MSRKTEYENYRVEIVPRRIGDFGSVSVSDRMVCSDEADRQRQYRERCQEIAEQVRRHVDNVWLAHIAFDTVQQCEYCGAAWTEKDPDYNGGCCDKDQGVEDSRAAIREATA